MGDSQELDGKNGDGSHETGATPPGGVPPPVPPPTPIPSSPGSFRVELVSNSIECDYDPYANGHITQEQLDLMADVTKTEAALKTLFYPTGLPADLRLRPPVRPSQRVSRDSSTPEPKTPDKEPDDKSAEEDPPPKGGATPPPAKRNAHVSAADRTKATFRGYFNNLFLIAQIALDGPQAQPRVGRSSLENLKNEILVREGGRVKNNYMWGLLKSAFALGIVPVFFLAFFEALKLQYSQDHGRPAQFNGSLWFTQPIILVLVTMAFAWVGALAGTFLSFGIRNPSLTFDQLAIPEDHRMQPLLRLIYVGMLAVVAMAAILVKAVSISVGSLSTAHILEYPSAAFVIGLFCGLSERALGDKLRNSADAMTK